MQRPDERFVEPRRAVLPVQLAHEYAGATGKGHTKVVYVRESDVTPTLDEWLISVFDPKHLDATVAAMAAAQAPTM